MKKKKISINKVSIDNYILFKNSLHNFFQFDLYIENLIVKYIKTPRPRAVNYQIEYTFTTVGVLKVLVPIIMLKLGFP